MHAKSGASIWFRWSCYDQAVNNNYNRKSSHTRTIATWVLQCEHQTLCVLFVCGRC